MTEIQQYKCPYCDYSAGSPTSVAHHITGKSDAAHKDKYGGDHWEDIEKVAVDDTASSSAESSESPDGSTDESVHFPTADGGSSTEPSSTESTEESSGSDCCSNPELQGEPGDYVPVGNGEAIVLEEGDQACVNCGEIHE